MSGPPIVVDCGTSFMKAGFSSEDTPRGVFPTVYGETNPTSQSEKRKFYAEDALEKRSTLTLRRPIFNGRITSMERMEPMWFHTCYNVLRVPPEDHPVLLADCPLNPRPARESIAQLLFETFNHPAIYLANQAVLALHASGRTTGLVMDSGAGKSNSVPVYEGHALNHATEHLDCAGDHLDTYLVRILNERGYSFTITSDYSVPCAIKEKLGYVAQDFEMEMEAPEKEHSWELPDGQRVTITKEAFRCTEPLFQPSFLGMESAGIHEMTYNAIMKCFDIRAELYNNIVLAGGNSMYPGMADRLQRELTALAPSHAKVRIIAPPDRKLSTWIGGSILSSLSVFAPRWVTRQEYDDFGPVIIHRKCF